MIATRFLPACLLISSPLLALADVAPPPRAQVGIDRAQADAAAQKRATCSPSYEEGYGPRGKLITHRRVEYDLMFGELTVAPPEARAALRTWLERSYKAIRPCLPPAAELRSPERLPIKLHLFLASGKLSSVVPLSGDKRVDGKCVEETLCKQEAPSLPAAVPTARASAEVTLAPFCVVSREIQRGDELPSPATSGLGFGGRHLIPPAASAKP